MLDQSKIEAYRQWGYITMEDVLTPTELQELQDVTDMFVARSRSVTENDDVFDLEPDHSPQLPKVRRLLKPHLIHPAYNATLRNDRILDIVSRLVGTAAVRFNGTKLNMKTSEIGSPVEWHQDWAFYPHTNDDLLAVGIAIDDMTTENGCLRVIPGSHRGRVYDHHQDGRFVGAITEDFDDGDAKAIEVGAGGISIHHVRTLHASMPNRSAKARRLLLFMYCSGDSYSLFEGPGQIPGWEAYEETFLRGEPSPEIRITSCPVRFPFPGPLRPGSIFENQAALRGTTLKDPTG